MTTRFPEYDDALPGYGAFKGADRKDAKRRRPDVSLEGFARARGLDFLDTLGASGFAGVMPGDSRLQFNVMRGTLSDGREGALFHQLLAVPYEGGDRGVPGVVFSVYKPKLGKRDALSFLPVVGTALDLFMADKDKRPQAVGVPVTAAAALVPEVALVPRFACREDDIIEMPWSGRVKLGDHGVPDWGLQETGAYKPDDAFVARLMSTSFGDALRALSGRAYARVEVAQAQVVVRVDGFLADEGELDWLWGVAELAARGLAEAGAAESAPRPWADPLPPPRWPREPKDVLDNTDPFPPLAWVPWLEEIAQERGWTPEDPVAYHRALPHLPVPGTAFVVMRLTPPGSSATARFAWHNELDPATHNVGRNAVLLPAAPGASTEGVVRQREPPLLHTVKDGLLFVWSARKWETQREGPGDIDGLVEQALRLGRETGLAAL